MLPLGHLPQACAALAAPDMLRRLASLDHLDAVDGHKVGAHLRPCISYVVMGGGAAQWPACADVLLYPRPTLNSHLVGRGSTATRQSYSVCYMCCSLTCCKQLASILAHSPSAHPATLVVLTQGAGLAPVHQSPASMKPELVVVEARAPWRCPVASPAACKTIIMPSHVPLDGYSSGGHSSVSGGGGACHRVSHNLVHAIWLCASAIQTRK